MDDSVAGLQERRCGVDRRCGVERRAPVLRVAGQAMPVEKRAPNVVLDVVGSMAMAALGVGVYKATGLYDAAEPGVARLVFGSGIALWFIYSFRAALYL
jgi:hypothetical protein